MRTLEAIAEILVHDDFGIDLDQAMPAKEEKRCHLP
jgi:hypothetical protein